MVQSGFPKIILNNDKEPAIMELNRAAMRLAREETVTEAVPEESNEYVSQTNGFVEQAVQAVERKGRTLKFSVEVLHDVTLLSNHASSGLGSGICESDHESLAFERRRGKSVRRARLSLQDVVTGMMLGKKKLKKSTEHVRQSSLGFYGIEKWGHWVSTVKRLSEAQRMVGSKARDHSDTFRPQHIDRSAGVAHSLANRRNLRGPEVQDLYTRLLSANLDSDSELQHVFCWALGECRDSRVFLVDRVFLRLC